MEGQTNNTPDSPRKGKGPIIGAISLVVIGLIAIASYFSGKKTDQVATNTDQNPVPTVTPSDTTTNTPTPTATASATASPSPSATPTTSSSSKYKDGTYSAEGAYSSPGGAEHIEVTLTLKNDKVTAATVTSGVGSPEGKRYQAMFIANFKQYVIGKSLTSLSLTKVSGSSLTPGGFNNAVESIKVKAQA